MTPKKILAICAILALLTGTIPITAAEESHDIVIKDSRGVTIVLPGPATHVAAFGAFATKTLVDIGKLDKAVIFDATSAYEKSGIMEVKNVSSEKFITVSNSNKDAVIQNMLKLVDDGEWNKTTDVIFGYGYGYLSQLWTELEGYGFKVMTFYPTSYDGVVQVVKDIETVVGAEHDVSDQMAYVKTYIAETLEENGINETSEKVRALYASYSSNILKLGNGGSITVDFINAAGGFNVANDTSKAVPTYSADFTAILQLEPEFVLLDGYYTGTADEFKSLIGDDDIVVYKLNKTWNSYCPDAMTGLWAIANLFYPEYFTGEIPVQADNTESDDMVLYVGVGIGVAIVAVATLFVLRKR
ncbi:MAG: ABC transporter substrate-binding protein [Methanomassiliicoccales archaeon]|nr:MAG: ABC transporter substrate-binding protein [Methanomassiliicoccales archaeon]